MKKESIGTNIAFTSDFKNRKGITLIALVITIIVMLIIVIVTVKIVSDSELFIKAQKAVSQTERKSIKEQLEQAAIAAYNHETQTIVKEDLEEEIKKIYPEAEIEEPEGKNFFKTTIKGEEFRINKASGRAEENKFTGKIGDLVNYNPDVGTIKIESGDAGSGYTSQQEFTTQTGNEALQWRILNINGGQVTIVSSTSTNSILNLKGASGWAHSVDILDDICNKCYSKQGIGVARSIDVDDINNLSGYIPASGTTISEYTNWRIPNAYIEGIGESDRSDVLTITEGVAKYTNAEYQGYTTILSDSGVNITTTQALYYPENQENYQGIMPTGLINVGSNYLLASRCTVAYASSSYFNMRYMVGGFLCSGSIFGTDNTARNIGNYLRPVVVLDSNVEFTYDTTNECWNIL